MEFLFYTVSKWWRLQIEMSQNTNVDMRNILYYISLKDKLQFVTVAFYLQNIPDY